LSGPLRPRPRFWAGLAGAWGGGRREAGPGPGWRKPEVRLWESRRGPGCGASGEPGVFLPRAVPAAGLWPGHWTCSWDGQCNHLPAEGQGGSKCDHSLAMGTALVYHEDMTATRLLWEE
jgi:hypothetical protein